MGIEASTEDDLDNRHSIHEHHHEHHHDHDHDDDINTVMVEYAETSDIKELVKELKVRVQQEEIYRIKGFVNIFISVCVESCLGFCVKICINHNDVNMKNGQKMNK